jgi:hypothetical protein
MKATWYSCARWGDRGWECTLTPEGRDIAEGRMKVLYTCHSLDRHRSQNHQGSKDPVAVNPIALRSPRKARFMKQKELDELCRMNFPH